MWDACHSMACHAVHRSTPGIQIGKPRAAEAEHVNLTAVPPGLPHPCQGFFTVASMAPSPFPVLAIPPWPRGPEFLQSPKGERPLARSNHLVTFPTANLFFTLLCGSNTWHILGTQQIVASIIACFKITFSSATSLAGCLPFQANLLLSQIFITPQATCLMTPSLCICFYTCLDVPLHSVHLKDSCASSKTLFRFPFLWEVFSYSQAESPITDPEPRAAVFPVSGRAHRAHSFQGTSDTRNTSLRKKKITSSKLEKQHNQSEHISFYVYKTKHYINFIVKAKIQKPLATFGSNLSVRYFSLHKNPPVFLLIADKPDPVIMQMSSLWSNDFQNKMIKIFSVFFLFSQLYGSIIYMQ